MSAKTDVTRDRILQLCEDLVTEIQNHPNSKLCLKMALLQSDINTRHLEQIISNFRANHRNNMTVEAENIRPGDYLLTSNGMRQVIENVRKGPLRYVKIVDTTESGETVLTLQPWVMAIVQPPNV